MRILFVSSEAYPLAKTGGLADVSAALPATLEALGNEVRLLLPGYSCALNQIARSSDVVDLGEVAGFGAVRLIGARMPDTGSPAWLVDCPALFQRDGGLYQDRHGSDWPDNAERFALFSMIAARISRGEALLGWEPDIVHVNDWHAALVPVLLAGARRPGTVLTVHNLAFQGLTSWDIVQRLPIPEKVLPQDFEFYGTACFLKAGLLHADHITTVSPTYAQEIMTSEFGCGLEGVIRRRRDALSGILNGVDYGIWDPRCSDSVPYRYDSRDLAGKRACKASLQGDLGLDVDPSVPLAAFVNRLTHQKMAEALPEIISQASSMGVQLVIHGRGDRGTEAALTDLAAIRSGQVAVRIGYDEALAQRILAGADILLSPSRFEPCGLTQLYALRFGTLPVVRRVGGLSDTVVDATEVSLRTGKATGFTFESDSPGAVAEALSRACDLHAQPVAWRRMQQRAMAMDFGWTQSAREYLSLYSRLVAEQDGVDGDRRLRDAAVGM